MVTTPNGDRPDRLPQTLLAIAAEVEADETQIKQQILKAARAGDYGTVIEIVQRWRGTPSVSVASRVLPCPRKHLPHPPCLPQPPALESSPTGRAARLEAC